MEIESSLPWFAVQGDSGALEGSTARESSIQQLIHTVAESAALLAQYVNREKFHYYS